MAGVPFSEAGHMKFPNVGMQALSDVVGLLGVSLLSHYISRRVRLVGLSSLRGLRQVSLPRFLTVVTFIDSWAFLSTASLLVHGLGLELSHSVCASGVAICIAFYATSKAFIFLFLTEKVHVVWTSAEGTSRRKSPVYLFCIVMVLGYATVELNLIYQRIAYFRPSDGACVIGLKRLGSLLLLSYDTFINVTLLLIFLCPLLRARVRNLYLRSIAVRAVIATLLTLASSIINIIVLTIMNGQQLGWVCLASCGADVVMNASVLFWATSGSSLRPQSVVSRPHLGPLDGNFLPNGTFWVVGQSNMSQRPSVVRSEDSNGSTFSTNTAQRGETCSQAEAYGCLPEVLDRTELQVIIDEGGIEEVKAKGGMNEKIEVLDV